MTYDELGAFEHENWTAYVTGVVSCASRAKVTRAGIELGLRYAPPAGFDK